MTRRGSFRHRLLGTRRRVRIGATIVIGSALLAGSNALPAAQAAGIVGWGPPDVVSQASSYPNAVAATAGSGMVVGYWQQASKTFVFRRHTGAGWTAEKTLATGTNGIEEELALAASDSLVHAVVSLGVTAPQLRYLEHDGDAITRTVALGAGDLPSIALDATGTSTIVAVSQTGDTATIVAWRVPASGAAIGPLTLDTVNTASVNGQSFGAPQVVVDSNGVPAAIWTQCDASRGSCLNGGSRVFKYSRFAGGGWSAPSTLVVTGSPQFFSLAAGGSAVGLAWNRTGDNGIAAATFSGGGWTPEDLVSPSAGGVDEAPALAVSSSSDLAILLPNQRFFTKATGAPTGWIAGPDFPTFTSCTAGAGRIPLVFESGSAVGIAAVATGSSSCAPSQVVAYRIVGAQSPQCAALQSAFQATTDAAIRQQLGDILTISGCSTPQSPTTTSTTSTTAGPTTTIRPTTTTSTQPSTTTTTISIQSARCAQLGSVLARSSDPFVRQALQMMIATGCR